MTSSFLSPAVAAHALSSDAAGSAASYSFPSVPYSPLPSLTSLSLSPSRSFQSYDMAASSLSSSLLPPPPSPPSLPSTLNQPLWRRSVDSLSAGLVLRSSTFRPSTVSLSHSAAVSIRAIMRATSKHNASAELGVNLSANLVEVGEAVAAGRSGRGQQLTVNISSATEATEDESQVDDEVSDGDDGVMFASTDCVDQVRVEVKRCRSPVESLHTSTATLHWSADEYSAQLDELTRRMDRHRLQPAMQHYIRAFGALLKDTSLTQQPLLHIECLSPSLSLHLTPLLPSAITLQPSPLLHSLLSRGPALHSFASATSSSQSGYLTLTVDEQVRLLSLPSEVLSLPLLGVYSSSPPSSLSTFVQCVHFLYSRSISRLTVAPLTFLLLSLHNRRTHLYEVSATMNAVAIEHCEADMPLSIGSQQQLSVPLRPLSPDRIHQLWSDTDAVEGGSTQPSMSASTATTETETTTADSGSSSGVYGGRDVTSWSGVYSDGESELGDGDWPLSPHSLRSPSPLPVSPPKPHRQRTIQAPHDNRAEATRTDKGRKGAVAGGKENEHVNSLNSGRVAARCTAAEVGHLSRAKSAAAGRSEALTSVEAKKRQLQAVSARKRERRATEMTARKQMSAAATAAVERGAAATSNNQTIKRSTQRRAHNKANDNKRYSGTDPHGGTSQQDGTAPSQHASVDSSDQPQSLPPLHHTPSNETQQAKYTHRTVAVREVVVRMDDTRSECETEERRRDIQQVRKERMERRLQAMRHGNAQPITSSHPTMAIVQPVAPLPPPQSPIATPLHPSTPATSPQSVDLISLLLSTSTGTAPLPHLSASASDNTPHAPLNAAFQLLRLLMQAAQLQPLSASRASDRRERETANIEDRTNALHPTTALESPSNSLNPQHTAAPIDHEVEVGADESEGGSQRGTPSNTLAAPAASDMTAPRPLSPTSPAVQHRADNTNESRGDEQQHVCGDDSVTQVSAEGGWESGEEKYPLTPVSLPAEERRPSDTNTDYQADDHRWGGMQSPELTAPTTSTRSPSSSHSHSALSFSSDEEHTDESSEDEWRPTSMSLSPLSLSAILSLGLSSPTRHSISASSSTPFSLSSLGAMGIPRINAAGIANSLRLQSFNSSSNEDEDEEETLLSKYDDGRSRMKKRWSRQRR